MTRRDPATGEACESDGDGDDGGTGGGGAARVRVSRTSWGTHVELVAPHVLNAIDRGMAEALLAVFEPPGSDTVALTAAGPAFSAGGDVESLRAALEDGRLPDMLAESVALFHRVIIAMLTGSRPIVAGVQGVAAGGGMALALACDVRVAGPSSALVPAYLDLGTTPDGGASLLLARAIGPAAARSAFLTGRRIGARSPLAPLVFDEIVDDDRVAARAVEEAERMARLDATSVASLRRLMLASWTATLADQLEAERAMMVASARRPGFADGIRRFLERRRR